MAVCDITRSAVRANQGLTLHWDPVDGAAGYKIYLVSSEDAFSFEADGSPFFSPPVKAGQYDVVLEAVDAEGVAFAVGTEHPVEIAPIAKSAGRILRQQLSDILHAADLDGCFVLRDRDGNYEDMHSNNAMLGTKLSVITVGPGQFQASAGQTIVRRVETWEMPIHIVCPGGDFDISLEGANEVVGQVLRAVEAVEYLGVPGIGVSDRAWRWTSDTSFDEDTGTVMYSLLLAVDVQTDIP